MIHDWWLAHKFEFVMTLGLIAFFVVSLIVWTWWCWTHRKEKP